MKKVLVTADALVAASLAFGLYLCSMPSVAVKDARQPETLVIGQRVGNAHTYAITLRGSGQVDGRATITLLLRGQPYKVAELSGAVDFRWGGDWYAETAEIRYEPANVRSGKVVLHYQFHQ